MKYSILLTGNNKIIMDEFFTHLWDRFECMSCSGRSEDIINHLKYMNPAAVVFCLSGETVSSINQVISYKEKSGKIPLVIIGSSEECEVFEAVAPGKAQLKLVKPMSIGDIARHFDKLFRELTEKETIQEEKTEQEQLLSEISTLYNQMMLEEPKLIERKRILVVDDDTLMLKLIKGQLHEEYDVSTAINGKVALKFLENKKADLILLDYEMPEEDGPTVFKKLRSNNMTKNIPVIFLTGVSERDKIEKVLTLKPQGYILKPIDRNKLISTIKKQIG